MKNKLTERIELSHKEVSARGGRSRAKKHSKEELRKWGKMGGRPKRKLDKKIRNVVTEIPIAKG